MTEKTRKDKEFINLLKTARLDSRSKGMELRDLLSKPFQRIFAYKNIFNRLLEYTPKESSSYQPIEKLVNEMEDLVQALNQAKRRFENEQKIQRISSEWGESQERLGKYLLKGWRKYIREGRLKVSISNDPLNWADCFLANDVFIAITENGLKSFYLCFSKLQQETGAQSPTSNDEELIVKLECYPISCRIKFADTVERNQWTVDFNKCISLEEQNAREILQEEASSLLTSWLKTINELPNVHQKLNDVGIKLRTNAEELDKVNEGVSELQSEIKDRLSKIAAKQQQKRGLEDNKLNAKKDHSAQVKNLQKLLEQGENTKRSFEKLLRRDREAFMELFSSTYQTLEQYKEQLDLALVEVLSYNDPSESHSTTNALANHTTRVVSLLDWSKQLGSKILSEEIREQMKGVDVESRMFEYAAKNNELQHRLSASADRLKFLEEERTLVMSKLAASDERFHVLQRQYQEQLASRWTSSTNESNDIIGSLMNATKAKDEEILALKKTCETEVVTRTELQNNLEATTDRAFRAEAEVKELREKLRDSTAPTTPTTPTDKYNLEMSSIQSLNKRLQEHTIYLQDRIEQVRFEKQKLGERFTDRIKSIDETVAAQIKAQYDLNALLVRTNQQLRDQLVEANKAVITCEEQVKGMIEQQIKDNEQINRQSNVLESTRKREEETRIELMHTLYKSAKVDKTLEESEDEIKSLKLTLLSRDEELTTLRAKLETLASDHEPIQTGSPTHHQTTEDQASKRSNTKSLAIKFSRVRNKNILPTPPMMRRTSLEGAARAEAMQQSPVQQPVVVTPPQTPSPPVITTPPTPVITTPEKPHMVPTLLQLATPLRTRSHNPLPTSPPTNTPVTPNNPSVSSPPPSGNTPTQSPVLTPNTPTINSPVNLLVPNMNPTLRKSNSNYANSPVTPKFDQLLNEMRQKKIQREQNASQNEK
jgi:hypothetical protein